MSDNKTLRATVAFLIVRDEAHQAAFAKALETLGVDWKKALPVPKFDSSKYPEVKRLLDAGVHREQYHFRLDSSMMELIFKGPSPFSDGSELVTLKEPRERFPIPMAPERPEEFAPGFDPELQALADAFSEFKEKMARSNGNGNGNGNMMSSKEKSATSSKKAGILKKAAARKR